MTPSPVSELGYRFSVPATTANLGPGFDSLGMALALRNVISVQPVPGEALDLKVTGAVGLPAGEDNLMVKAMRRVLGERKVGAQIEVSAHIPPASGMGSSAAAIVSGVMAGSLLLDDPLEPADLIKLAVEIEGHPDNVAAAMLGGLTASSYVDGTLLVRRIPTENIRVVIALPKVEASTADQRAALPDSVPLKDAAANIGRAVLVVEALRAGDLGLLRDAMVDCLHVPARSEAIPGYEAVVRAAQSAGAQAVTISGAGPAVIAFAGSRHRQIAAALETAFRSAGAPARTWVLPVDRDGLRGEQFEGEA
ncbi:MAG: homoserine kinase [Chloroflexi bacterium]|nr:homoserine kinase [Chloroflexota bacterium]